MFEVYFGDDALEALQEVEGIWEQVEPAVSASREHPADKCVRHVFPVGGVDEDGEVDAVAIVVFTKGPDGEEEWVFVHRRSLDAPFVTFCFQSFLEELSRSKPRISRDRIKYLVDIFNRVYSAYFTARGIKMIEELVGILGAAIEDEPDTEELVKDLFSGVEGLEDD